MSHARKGEGGYHGQVEKLGTALVGFRAWRLDPNGLRSIRHAAGYWKRDGYTFAKCLRPIDEGQPCLGMPDCHCGLYAFSSMSTMRMFAPICRDRPGGEITAYVIGATVHAGKSVIHEYGFRSMAAKPIALLDARDDEEPYNDRYYFKPELSFDPGRIDEILTANHAVTQGLAVMYGIPLLKRPALLALAGEHGAAASRHGVLTR